MSGTQADVDDELVERVKRSYGVTTAGDAIDLALRRLDGEISTDPHDGLLAHEGIGWDADLSAVRGDDPTLGGWLHR